MYASEPSYVSQTLVSQTLCSQQQVLRTPRSTNRAHQRRHHHPQRTIAFETIIKLTVYTGFLVFASSTLTRTVSHLELLKTRLQEVQAAREFATQRFHQVQARFIQSFDPQQAPSIIQEQSNLTGPQQRRVFFAELETNPSPESVSQ